MNRASKSLSVKEKAKQLQIAYAVTFDSESGKQVLRDLLDFCHILTNPFIQGQADSTNFRLGEYNVGLKILKELEVKDITELQKYAEVD